jgi:inosine-uridine nucleoside N-ribohydrolase
VAADVETKGALTRGMTVYDLRPGPISGKTPLFQPGPDGTVEVAVGVRAGDVLDAVLGAFA